MSLETNWSRKLWSRCSVHFCCVQGGRSGGGLQAPRVLTDNSPPPGEDSGQGSHSQREAARGADRSHCVQFPSPVGLEIRGGPVAAWGVVHWPTLAYFQPFLTVCLALPVAKGPVQGRTLAVENRFPRVLASSRGRDGQGWHPHLAWFRGWGGLESLLANADSRYFFSVNGCGYSSVHLTSRKQGIVSKGFQGTYKRKKLVTLKQEGAFLAV